LKREIVDFIDAIENKREPIVTGKDGAEAIKIANAALESIKKKEKVWLD